VATEEHGEHGFGYDPIFIPEGFEVTAAELEPEVKNSMSHRALALEQLVSYLNAIAD
jgi:XTP/dITP diphosphohydrolase